MSVTCKDCRWCLTNSSTEKFKCPKTLDKHYRNDCLSSCRDYEYIKQKTPYSRGGFGWYITTAICEILGYSQESEVFKVLSSLRIYMESTEKYQDFLKNYDIQGPLIGESIKADSNPFITAINLLTNFLIPCANLIKVGNFEEASAIYIKMVQSLQEKYAMVLATQNICMTENSEMVPTRILLN